MTALLHDPLTASSKLVTARSTCHLFQEERTPPTWYASELSQIRRRSSAWGASGVLIGAASLRLLRVREHDEAGGGRFLALFCRCRLARRGPLSDGDLTSQDLPAIPQFGPNRKFSSLTHGGPSLDRRWIIADTRHSDIPRMRSHSFRLFSRMR